MLTGILVRFEAGKLVMVATDSYRLSVKETELEAAAPELEAIIPARALQELARLGAAGGDTVELGVHENHVVFGTGDAWLTTRRIDGQFPNYRQLMPETFEVELTIARAELYDVVRRDRRARAAELTAPPALHGGRADGVGADAGRRRGEGVAPGRATRARSS